MAHPINNIQGAINKINTLSRRVRTLGEINLSEITDAVTELSTLQNNLKTRMNELFRALSDVNVPNISRQTEVINDINRGITETINTLNTLLSAAGGTGAGGAAAGGTEAGGAAAGGTEAGGTEAGGAAAGGTGAGGAAAGDQTGGYRYGRYRTKNNSKKRRSKSRNKSHKKRRRHHWKKVHKTRSKRR
jgi:hypothetical protein